MFDLTVYLEGLAVTLALAFVTWLASIVKRDVSIVDSVWALLLLAAAAVYALGLAAPGPQAVLVLILVGSWALRLTVYVTWRNWGEPEDRRYQAIRRNHQPHFALKSLFWVFGLQAAIAWLVSLPLLAAIAGTQPLGWLDYLGAALWCAGFAFETIADWQLARFKADPANQGRVLARGLWRYSRHPNYFGECCLWWGLYLIALAAGGWWSVVGPLLMTFLLLRVSGVALLEKDINERRPAYRDYIQRTHAFIPGPPRAVPGGAARG